MTDPALSPIAEHLRLLAMGAPIELGWITRGDLVHPLAALGLLAVALTGRPAPTVIAALLALNLVAARQTIDPAYDWDRLTELREAVPPGATLLAATHRLDDSLLDLERGARVISMNAPTDPADPLARALWADARRGPDPLVYLTWLAPVEPQDWTARWLWQHAYFGAEQMVGPNHRALTFQLRDAAPRMVAAGQRFGPIELAAYGIAATGDDLYLALDWHAAEPVLADYRWFVHLLDAEGQIIAQQDRAPGGGYAPTVTWSPGETVTDRLYFPAAADAVALRVGWVDLSGNRLPARSPDGTPLEAGFAVLPLGEPFAAE
jgi:hypothetical protein